MSNPSEVLPRDEFSTRLRELGNNVAAIHKSTRNTTCA